MFNPRKNSCFLTNLNNIVIQYLLSLYLNYVKSLHFLKIAANYIYVEFLSEYFMFPNYF
jgi:hypothetical protein